MYNVYFIAYLYIYICYKIYIYIYKYTGVDPGFVVSGGVSRRGVWGPLKVPSWSRVEPW